MKKLLLLIIILCASISVTGCAAHPFEESDFIGKTSADITAGYGAFDCTSMPIGDDGLYRSARCGYMIREPKTGLLGTSPELFFFIIFDENGIAVECETGYRPGG